ncbi:two-component regulator propeller domain-containing protein [Fulvivirgaceae bacterium BMA10]|uniref:histidine kinase n=1 Tax=Splendidivirga corallicola TaxID=3051826 RepID=A0ABT8KZ17_9BACT|nr:two-component regulator propeller domain-containing protein [Fulvivirgaceae bacterium BMA10]
MQRLTNMARGMPLYYLILLLLSVGSFAQEKITFERISVDQGLSQAAILSIFQDRHGFLWFGTRDGLNRYDGYDFTVFKSVPGDTSLLSDNTIWDILEDKNGRLWIGTSSGLNLYDPSYDKFETFYLNKNEQYNHSDWVEHLFIQNDSILLTAATDGLYQFSLIKKRYRTEQELDLFVRALAGHFVYDIHFDSKGRVWAATQEGLKIFNSVSDTTQLYFNNSTLKSLEKQHTYRLLPDKDGNLWIGALEGVFKYDPLDNTLVSLSDLVGGADLRYTTELAEDNSGNIWIIRGVVHVYNKASGVLTNYNFNPNDNTSLSGNQIRAVFKSKNGTMWLGSVGFGINKYDPLKNKFVHIKHVPNDENSLIHAYVRSIFTENNNVIWIGTPLGLNRYDKHLNQFERFPTLPHVNTMLLSENGELLLGTPNGIKVLDDQTKQIKPYRIDIEPIMNDHISTMVADSEGNLWIGLFSDLIKFNPKTDEIQFYSHVIADPIRQESNIISQILFADSVLWVGTESGLNCINLEHMTCTKYLHDKEDNGSISDSFIKSLYIDSKGVLWVGTWGGGLNRYNAQQKTFIHYTEENGLPNNVVYGILEDSHDNLWMSTNKGITKFDPKQETFTNYTHFDGLQGNEFNTSAYFKAKDGTMYFGGLNGLNYFHPDNITSNPIPPITLISKFLVRNEEVHIGPDQLLQKSIMVTDTIVLAHNQNMFGLEFLGINYSNPIRNQYAYILENFDDQWNPVGTRRFANYTNVPPGNYVFRVKSANSDGIWDDAGADLMIIVKRPFWKTWWFYLSLVVLLSSFIYSGHLYRTNWIKERNRALEKEITIRKKAEYDLRSLNENLEHIVEERTSELKNQKHQLEHTLQDLKQTQGQLIQSEKMASLGQLIAGISHEINTPLGAINASIHMTLDQFEYFRESLETFLPALSNGNSQFFFLLVDLACKDFKYHTSREQRQLKKALSEKLQKHRVPNAEEVADLLSDMGIYEDAERLVPFLKNGQSLKIIDKAKELASIHRASKNIEMAVLKASKILNALKSYMRGGAYGQLSLCDIRENIENILIIYQNQLKQGVEVIKDFEEIPMIKCYPDELNQVWTNIIHNGIQAMHNKGTMTIKISEDQDNVKVSISDTGPGIPKDIEGKIFDAFYTTKSLGEGTGLGLGIAKDIVEKHAGHISFTSVPGNTIFTVVLPKSLEVNEVPD